MRRRCRRCRLAGTSSRVAHKFFRGSRTAAGQSHLESTMTFWRTAQGILLFSGEFHLKSNLDLRGGGCYVHSANCASTLDDAPQVRCYGYIILPAWAVHYCRG